MSDDEDVESNVDYHAARVCNILKLDSVECTLRPGHVIECNVGKACHRVAVAAISGLVESGEYHDAQVKLDSGIVLARTQPDAPKDATRKRKRDDEIKEVEILNDSLQSFPTRARERVRKIALDLMRLDPWGSPTVRSTMLPEPSQDRRQSPNHELHELTAHGTHTVRHEALEDMIKKHSYIVRADYHFGRAAIVLRLQVPA